MTANLTPKSRRLAIILGLLVGSIVGLCRGPNAAGDDVPSPPARFLLEWGDQGSAPGEFHFPIGIAVTKSGEVLVSDFYNARVQKFTAEGKFLTSFAVLPNPGGMALDADGNIYLSHFTAMKKDEEKKPDRISVVSPDGKLLRQWGQSGTGDGEFDYPGGLAVTADRVYVADQTNRRVQVFNREGKFLFKWGEYGVKEGQFGGGITPKSRVGGPHFLAIDGDGSVYTTEGSTRRIQKFTADGKFLQAWGDKEDKAGGFGGGFNNAKTGLSGPVGICFDEQGHLWISAVSGRIQQFTKSGKFLQNVSTGSGSKPSEFIAPHALTTDGRGNLYVVDAYNHRVQKFAIGK